MMEVGKHIQYVIESDANGRRATKRQAKCPTRDVGGEAENSRLK